MTESGFSRMIDDILRRIGKEKIRNRKVAGKEFPDFKEKQFQPSSQEWMNRFPFRETGVSHILLLKHSVYMDVECYQQKRSGHLYQVWSYIPGQNPPCLLFQSDQNRNLRHRHDFTEIVYVCSGVYTTEIGGEL